MSQLAIDSEKEEHIDDTRPRKAVGLFARSIDNTSVFELSAVSTATGYALLTSQVDPASSSGGVTTVFQGGAPWQSLVTVNNFPGVLSLASGQEIKSLATIVNTVDIALPNGLLDSFGHMIIGDINNDIDVQFYRATSDSNLSNIITETEASGGTASKSNGMATFATTTTNNSRAKGVSLVPSVYTAGAEVYAIFTAAFPTATSGTGSYRRIGLYNDFTDGLFIGYETTDTFGISILKGGSQTTTLKANFSIDTLVGGAGSKFTRNGTPEAIDLTKLNVFRIRFGWVGSAPIIFEVLSPDGKWVQFHKILQPNLAAVPSLNTADLYFTCDVATGTSGNAQSILTNCWGAGTTQKLRKISDTVSNDTLAGLTRAVITGQTTGGGGSYVNVKVNPSGTLETNANQGGTWSVGVTGLVSLASGTEVRSLATVLNWPTTLVSLASGTEVRSLTTILPRTDYIGLVSVSGNVAVSNFVAPNLGNVTLNASSAHIGSVSIFGTVSSTPGNVTLNPSSAHIGSVSIFGTVQSTPGMTTLFPGPNQIGSVSISGTPTIFIGTPTIFAVVNTDGTTVTANQGTSPWVTSVSNLISLASGTEMRSLTTVLNFPTLSPVTATNLDIRDLTSASDTIGAVQSGSWDIRSLLSTATLYAVVNTGAVGNTNALATLLAGPNQIGSVTISNIPAVTQSGSWDVRSLLSLASVYGKVDLGSSSDIRSVLSVASIYGNVGVIGTVAVTQSGTWDEVGINDSGNSITVDGNVGITGLVSLASGTELRSLTTILPRTDYIGLVSVSGNVAVSSIAAGDNNIGNVDLASAIPAGTAQIGSVTVSNTLTVASHEVTNAGTFAVQATQAGSWDVRSLLSAATLYAVVNTGAVGNTNALATLLAGPNQIGSVTISHPVNSFATVTPILSSTVVNFMVSCASGKVTQFPDNAVRQGIIQADSTNVSNAFIGNSAVTSGIGGARGIELQPGQGSGIEIDNTNKLYLALATGASGMVSFFGSG